MSQSGSLDQAIYLIAKELKDYLSKRGGQINTGAGMKLSIAYTLFRWIEEEYNIRGLTDVITAGIELSHNEIAVRETVAQKNVSAITSGLMQKFEVTNQALRGIPIVPAPDLGSSNKKSEGLIRKGLKKLGI